MFKRLLFSSPLVFTIAVLLCGSVVAQKNRMDISEMSDDGSGISWRVVVPHKSVILTVSTPDGTIVRREFQSGTTPIFSLAKKSGEPYGDGLFKYELVITPILDPEVLNEMMASRKKGNSDKVAADLKKRGLLPDEVKEFGSFRLLNGQLLSKNDPGEPTPDKAIGKFSEAGEIPSDNVVLSTSDGVIRNSLCVGFDCPNSPAFDDSTILLMENNTRIKFGDTSNSPFPNNDWEIEANSSLSGGANYLGFNDCGTADNDGGCATDLVFAVEAGVRQNALYVESDGDIGIGTSNPVLDLHIVTGNTPAIRLDQDNSSGFTPQVWDIAGNETNFFVRDVTAGSRLPFRIQPNSPSNSIFVQGTTGDVGFGTSAPNADLDIRRAGGRVAIAMEDTTSGNSWQIIMDNDASANPGLSFTRAGTGVREFRISPTGSLIVNGTTTMNVPDYVFAPDYKLMPLEEVAEFIRKNGRLPDMQSAADVKSNGLDLTQMTLRLLEKVEELTLHTIAQQKALDARGREARQMKAEIEALKNVQTVSQ